MKAQWQTLPLTHEVPRSEAMLAKLDLMRGLSGWQGFGMMAMLGPVMAIFALVAIPGSAGDQVLKIFAGLIAAGIGLSMLRHAKRQLALRREALLHGLPVSGSITRHGKRFNPFSSSSHATVSAVFWLPEREQTATGILWRREALRDLPLGSQLLGLWLPDKNLIWLPLEIGVRIEAEPLMPPEKVLDTAEEADSRP